MNIKTSKGGRRFNPALVVFSTMFVVAYGVWELRSPSSSGCGYDLVWLSIARVGLVSGWMAYINLIRARREHFRLKHFLHGAFSGGGAFLIAVVLLVLIEWVGHQILGLGAARLPHVALVSLPVVMISGLYSAFATNVEIAIGQGITCMALQLALFAVLIVVASLDMCTY